MPKRGKPPERTVNLIKVMMLLGLTMVIGIYWDVWWHVNIGRDFFWEPPHMVVYSAMAGILIIFVYLFFKGKLGFDKWIVLAGFILMVSAAPFDEWWHVNILGGRTEVGLEFMSPPHIMLAIGGGVTGLGIMRILAFNSVRRPDLRKYLFIYIFAGYLMIMLAMGILDPRNLSILAPNDFSLGVLGTMLFTSVPAGFYVFTRKILSRFYVAGLGLGEGIIKTLLEGSPLHFPSLFISSLVVAKLKIVKNSYLWSFLVAAIAGGILSTYVLFFANYSDALGIIIKLSLGTLSAGFAGLLANYLAIELFKDYSWKKI